ncbi:MAG TPA: cupredoxin family protein [Burkholderiaceae bacterium]|nr:cupredoxin family protein [Burkholderiaceae bacterium]
MNDFRKSLLVGAALAFAVGAARAHGDEAHPAAPRQYDARKVEETAFGREGNPKKVQRTIKVEMTDTMRFTPERIAVKRGETVRFVVHNGGQLLHEMVLGTKEAIAEHAELMKKFPEMEHADANIAHVRPSATGEIVWQFTKAGEFRFACLQPGHFEAGMVGSVTVK